MSSIKRKLYQKKYFKSKAGKIAQKRYRNSKKGKLTLQNQRLRLRYNIDLNIYNLLLKKQHYKCAICHKKFNKQLSVDHNHKTNKIRGLLCSKCNSILGFGNDSIIYFKKVIQYLK